MPHYPVLAVDRSAGARRGTLYSAWPEMASGTAGPSSGSVVATEPDEFFGNANPLVIGQDFRGAITSRDNNPFLPVDQDYWYFDGLAGQTVILSGIIQGVENLGYTTYGVASVLCGPDTLHMSELTRFQCPDGYQPVPPLVFTLPRTERYYVLIRNAFSYGTLYQLNLRELEISPTSVARDHRDIVLVSSSDGGQSWSPKTRVSNEPARYDDILPAVAVDDAGLVHVAWYGREDDLVCGVLANTYWTVSADGGATLLPARRVSSVSSSWDFDPAAVSRLESVAGDYLGLATVGTTANVLWMDSRNLLSNSSDIYGAQVTVEVATPVLVSRFEAEPGSGGIRIAWSVDEAATAASFHLYRARDGGAEERLALAMPAPASGPSFGVVDSSVVAGERYLYRLEVALAGGGSVWAGPVEVALPVEIKAVALRAIPNPSVGAVELALAVPARGAVDVAVYDVPGHVVAHPYQGETPGGVLQVHWDGRGRGGQPVPPGLYLVRASANGRQVVERLACV